VSVEAVVAGRHGRRIAVLVKSSPGHAQQAVKHGFDRYDADELLITINDYKQQVLGNEKACRASADVVLVQVVTWYP